MINKLEEFWNIRDRGLSIFHRKPSLSWIWMWCGTEISISCNKKDNSYNLCFFSPGQQVHKAKAVLACGELEALTINRTIILTFFFLSRIYARANFQKNFKLASVMETASQSPPEEATGLPFPPTLHTGLLIFKKFYWSTS